MRKHLQYGAGAGGTVHHQNGEKYQAAVRYGRVGIDVFQVGLYAGGECTIHYGDARQHEEYPSIWLNRMASVLQKSMKAFRVLW